MLQDLQTLDNKIILIFKAFGAKEQEEFTGLACRWNAQLERSVEVEEPLPRCSYLAGNPLRIARTRQPPQPSVQTSHIHVLRFCVSYWNAVNVCVLGYI
nr:hypothetical protein Itr_chr13CG05060 [Ipomoea trifida]